MKFGASKFGWVLSAVLALGGGAAYATDAIPQCLSYGRPLPINNDQVLHWKRTTPNQFRERGHISGVVRKVYQDKGGVMNPATGQSTGGHDHFSVQIGHNDGDTVEVIYNQDFGALPDNIPVGAQIEACGDFIVATAQSGPYPPSPDGAILHWVHKNPEGKGHDSGFLMINGTLYGQDAEHAGPGRPPYYSKPNKGNGNNYPNGGNQGGGRHYQGGFEGNDIQQFTIENSGTGAISQADFDRR